VKPKVFLTRPLGDEAVQILAARCEVSFNPQDSPLTPGVLAKLMYEAEGALVAGARLTAEVIAQAPRLRAVSNVGVGYDNLDLPALTARHIPVTNTAGVVEETTADLAVALLLAVARRVPEGDRYVRDGQWRQWHWNLLWGANVHHKTLGLYGFGHIGQAVARRARGFNMRIRYHARHRVPEIVERELDAHFVDREALLGESDFLSLHVPLTPETRHLIGTPELARMKPSAFLINTARGPIVDEQSLAEALDQYRIAGAALDVFEQEPHVHPSLMTRQNVVLAPHVGSATAETRAAMARVAAHNLLDLLDGKRPSTLLNPEALEGRSLKSEVRSHEPESRSQSPGARGQE
jgi:lactate dehydrogenase-like 2-hydroxyacid dehydrogenase